MRAFHMYIGNDSTKLVLLDKDIAALTPDTLSIKNPQLESKLRKAIDKNPEVVGIADFDVGQLTFTSNNKYTGIFWAKKSRVSGKYEIQ